MALMTYCLNNAQVEERGKLVCQPDGYYPSLTTEDVTVHFFSCLHLVL